MRRGRESYVELLEWIVGKRESGLTSGCSPSPHHRLIFQISARCVPAEPRVMLFATGVMNTKPLYGNGLIIFKIVESLQKSGKSHLTKLLSRNKLKRVKDAAMAKLMGCYPLSCDVTRQNIKACPHKNSREARKEMA